MKMTSTEIAEHLEKQANKFQSQADEFKNKADRFKILAKKYSDSGQISEEEECTTKAEECAVKEKDCRERAQDAIDLAQEVRDQNEKAISDINQLHELMDKCTSKKFSAECAQACKFLVELIKKFILEKTEPYSTSWGKCGKLTNES